MFCKILFIRCKITECSDMLVLCLRFLEDDPLAFRFLINDTCAFNIISVRKENKPLSVYVTLYGTGIDSPTLLLSNTKMSGHFITPGSRYVLYDQNSDAQNLDFCVSGT